MGRLPVKSAPGLDSITYLTTTFFSSVSSRIKISGIIVSKVIDFIFMITVLPVSKAVDSYDIMENIRSKR